MQATSVPNIVFPFLEAAGKHPQQPAIIEKDREISFGELAKEVKDTAAYFAAKGIGPDDRVLIFVPMGIDLYRTVLALFYLGASAVFLDEWVSRKRMELCCEIADCRAFIGTKKALLLSLLSGPLRRIRIRLSTGYRNPDKKEIPMFVAPADHPALLTFTTGSTGIPKAALRTHDFLWEQFRILSEKINAVPGEIDMPVLPVVLLLNLGTATTSVIADFKARKPASLRPEKILRQINKHNINRMTASPFFIKTLAEYIDRENSKSTNLKKIFTGGAPVFPNEAGLYLKTFTDADIEIIYGSTEAEPISAIACKDLANRADEVAEKGLPVGKIHPKAEVRIIPYSDQPLAFTDGQLEQYCLKPGEAGEIIVSGPHVLKQYLNNPEALKRNKIFTGEKVWHRTGDAGRIDTNRELYLLGRCSQVIGEGENALYPFLFENFCAQLPGISYGTLVMHQDRETACLEFKGADNSKQALQKQIMEEYPLVREVRFLKSIPKDPRHRSKIDYKALEKLL